MEIIMVLMVLVAVVVIILARYTAKNVAYIRRQGREQVELYNAIGELLRRRRNETDQNRKPDSDRG